MYLESMCQFLEKKICQNSSCHLTKYTKVVRIGIQMENLTHKVYVSVHFDIF